MEDYIVRATAAGAQIRAFACTTAELVETARQVHNTSPVVTAALGRLLSAGAMMGCMLLFQRALIRFGKRRIDVHRQPPTVLLYLPKS